MPTSTVWLKRNPGAFTMNGTALRVKSDWREVPGFGCKARFVSRTPYMNVELVPIMKDGSVSQDEVHDLEEPAEGFLDALAKVFGLQQLEVK